MNKTMIKNEYCFGNCSVCGKYTQLKNKLCVNCNCSDLPDFLKELFVDNPFEEKNEEKL
jgi:hypothetical protein